MSIDVIRKDADKEETSTAELSPLYETVDPDALDHLFTASDCNSLRVQFQYEGYRVTVADGADVTLSGLDD